MHILSNGEKKHKAVKPGKNFWCAINKHRGYNIIKSTLKATVNDRIIKHSHAIVSAKTNDCVKINVPGSNQNQYVPNILPQIYFRDLHKNTVRDVPQGIL